MNLLLLIKKAAIHMRTQFMKPLVNYHNVIIVKCNYNNLHTHTCMDVVIDTESHLVI